jgi:hypothetical protein
VWEVWTDVERWPAWDPELREASLDDATFEVGARGTLRPRVGPPAPFVVTDCEDVRSFCYAVDLPLAELDVRRSLHSHTAGRRSSTRCGSRARWRVSTRGRSADATAGCSQR